jgi:hypothetical protein
MSFLNNDEIYWMGEIPAQCQITKRKITSTFVDGRVPGMGGTWGFMHPEEFARYGGKLGSGLGQRYEKQPNGRWLKVEG